MNRESVTVTIIDEVRLGFTYLASILCVVASMSMILSRPDSVMFTYGVGVLGIGIGLFMYAMYKKEKMEASRALLFKEQEAMEELYANDQRRRA